MALIPIEERTIVPETLDFVPSAYGSQSPKLAWPVSELVRDLEKDARAAKFKAPQFRIISGYRSIASQKKLWAQALKDANGNASVARKTTAPPGTSSHHTGYAFDIFLGVGGTKMSKAEAQFKSKEYKYMRDVLGPKYNLTQLPNEPWHWECDSACREAYILSKYGRADYMPDESELNRMRLLSTEEFAQTESRPSNTGKVVLYTTLGVVACVGTWMLLSRNKNTKTL